MNNPELDSTNCTILIVDDQPENLSYFTEIIEKEFPQAQLVGSLNAVGALAIAKDLIPDLIITDWMMQGMDGIELIQALKKDANTHAIPIIMVSGINTKSDNLKMALKSGAGDFVRKPVDPLELTTRIYTMLTLANQTKEIIKQKQLSADALHELKMERAEKAVRKALFDKEAAMASENVKRQFFSKITHEFRTPLTLIMGPLESIAAQTKDTFSMGQADLALRNTKILKHLIDQLLDLSRINAGHLKPQLQYCNLSTFVEEGALAFKELISRKQLTLKIRVEDADLHLEFDPDMMTKVLNNLIGNSVKFTPAGGTIFVRVWKSLSHTNSVSFSIKDSGIGIPAERIPFIFDQFYRVEEAKNNGMEGTGLGLPLVKELVEAHAGSIKVTSLEGLGTEMSVLLPQRKMAAKAEPVSFKPINKPAEADTIQLPAIITDEPINPESNEPVVLIIDDNPDIRTYIQAELESDYIVLEAADGLAGIQKTKKYLPDIVITDVLMPGANGYEVCQAVKDDEKTCHIPVVMLTVQNSPSKRIEGLETGADAYLAKPFSAIELKVRIRKIIENRKMLRELYRKGALTQPSLVKVDSLDEQFLARLRKCISNHLNDELFSIEDLAREMAVSRTQLHRKLKAITDQNATEFVRNFRLEHARQLLEQNACSVGEVAFMVGFSSASYFSKTFSSRFGLSPKMIRNKESAKQLVSKAE